MKTSILSARARATFASFVGSKEHARQRHGAIRPGQTMRVEKAARGGMEIVARPKQGKRRLVTDDAEIVASGSRGSREFECARVGLGEIHARAIDIALQFRERVFPACRIEVIADAILCRGQTRLDETAFEGRRMKDAVVTGDRIVEINPDPHRLQRIDMSISGRPTRPAARSPKAALACSRA